MMTTTTASVSERSNEAAPLQISPQVGRLINKVLVYALLVVVGLILFMPFILAFLGTFKTNAEIIAWPPSILPRNWLVENWPTTIKTDLGGLARPEGTTSLGIISGMIAFLGTFVMIGQSAELEGQGLPRGVGLAATIGLAILGGVGAILYLEARFDPDTILKITLGAAIAVFLLIAVGIVMMSRPDWMRAILAMAASLVVGAIVTVVIDQLAFLAGGGRFLRWFFNIAVLATVRAFVMVIFCSMAAYAFARMKFPGRNALFNFMLATMMLPGAVTLIPAYIIIAKLGWTNSAYGLVFPYLADAFGIFMLTQFLKAIPVDLEEAALIDGASYFQIYKDVILPLARPALLTLFIIQFQGMWNDFLVPLLYLNTPDMWVMNVALSVFQQNYTEQWNLTLVGAMINAFIPLTMFFFFSRYYIEGVSYVGVKG
jgi:multiple sugar transport system permease protein